MFTQSFIAVACIAWMTLLFTFSVVVWVLDWWSARRDRVVARRRRERREEAATATAGRAPRLPQRVSDVTVHPLSAADIDRAERRRRVRDLERRARLTEVRR